MGTAYNHPSDLRDIARYTAQMRDCSMQRALLAEKRRLAMVQHFDDGVTIAAMARAMGITEAAVAKVIKNGPTGVVRARQSAVQGI
ncbi:helix-turn-helix domain-containing protein [Paenarthrobacter sp. NPDC089714]|uniref:helix-turn-helix domain-containing protein n=1 Tax=Paenarthrobacter sp. NPDC089714 TaxID=3364377 RepID=UPI003823F36A